MKYILSPEMSREPTFNGSPSEIFVHELRHLQFDMLSSLVSSSVKTGLVKPEPIILSRRLGLVTQLRNGLLTNHKLTSAEKQLLSSIDQFLDNYNQN